ncbi:ComEC family competence protein [Candidatus Methanoplasma termitum]|uniref:ComEC family competence protein n=1 Tax=Candidatus Methanoplasma termitum TaxID=1577791 RepID=A0A0A7LI89_9ARCH|nr:MBL fold metallo-hydrolase [Candidatus Methanoplasma termitum]AIZ57216.1 ComEC family competence protein [Candidatus Methanoplasma termitum]MCL2333960.1 MBL fold metallo-hydrolase [Candidatus Methanoplasma sp.]
MKKKSASVAVVLVLALVGGGAVLATDVLPNETDSPESADNTDPGHLDPGDTDPGTTVIDGNGMSIHFLELGTKYTGDCVFIDYGDIDILIDAGSKTASSPTIINYIRPYIQDNKIEYVIATHAHEDHISGFYSTKTTTGVLDAFEIGTIIDYPRSDNSTLTSAGNLTVRGNYETTRDKLVAEDGTAHYTALQCYNNEDGAQRVYELGPGVTMEVLYQPFYEKKATTENNYSVCIMITENGKQYLFTGDLEKAGEDAMVDFYKNDRGGLGHCVLYKGGHHGSSTSSNIKLLDAITPDYVIICTCAGSPEYSSTKSNQFPTQEFINRIASYTDKVYITTLMVDFSKGVYESFNGNVIFSVKDGEPTVTCSGSDKVLKDTDWFKENRAAPAAWT